MKFFSRMISCFMVLCLMLNCLTFQQVNPTFSLIKNVFAEELKVNAESISEDDSLVLSELEASSDKYSLQIGESANVTIFANYRNGNKIDITEDVSWSISHPEIARVSNGTIFALKKGHTAIAVEYEDQSLELDVNVYNSKVSASESEIQLESPSDNLTYMVGESFLPPIWAAANDGTRTDVTELVTWVSEDNQVVSVLEQEIKALRIGTSTLLGTYQDQKLEIRIVVEPNEELNESLDREKSSLPEDPVNSSQPASNMDTLAATDSITLSKGESYKFTNIYTSASYVKSNATSSNTYDYAIYLANGTGYDFDLNSKSTSRAVRSGGSMVVTVTSDSPVTFTITSSQMIYEESFTPALLKKSVSKGESVSLKNIIDSSNSIIVDGLAKEISYQSFKSDGSLSAESFDYSTSSLTIPANGKLIATVTSDEPVTFAGYYELLEEEAVEQALVFVTLEKGESFVFVNKTTDSQPVKINASNAVSTKKTYDSAIYKVDGTAHAQDADATVTSKSVPPGGKIVVTTTSSLPVTFKAFSSYFSGTKSDVPALLTKTANKDETIEIQNITNEKVTVLVNGSSSTRRYSYQLLNSDGSTYLQSYDSYNTSLSMPANGSLIATTISNEAVTFKGYYDLLRDLDSADSLITKTLEKDQTYSFTNNTSANQNIDTDGSLASTAKKTFDFAIYDNNGSPYSQGRDSGASSKIVPSGGKIVVTTTSELPVTFRAFESFFTGNESPKPALFSQSVSKGQAISITNHGSTNADLLATSNNGRFSYQIFLEGNPSSSGHDASFTSRAIPGGSAFLATITSEEPVTFSGYGEIFTSSLEQSSILQKTLGMNESYGFKNTSTQSQSIEISTVGTKSFDFAIYDSGGLGISQEMDAIGTSKTVPAGGKIVITNTSEDTLTLKGFLTDFAGIADTQPALLKQTIQSGESLKITNTTDMESELRRVDVFSTIETYNYEVHSRTGEVVSQEVNSSDTSLNVPSGGWVNLTVTSIEPVTFFGYYDQFTITNDGEAGIQFAVLDVNSFTDVLRNETKSAYFKMTTNNAGIYRLFTSSYQGNGSEIDTTLSIYSDSSLQNEIAMNDNHSGPYGSQFSKVEWAATANTTYYIKLESVESLQARLTLEEDLDSSRETAFPAEWDEIYTDRLSSPYDVDYYKLVITEPSQIHLFVTSNVVSLEDKDGNGIQSFYPNEPDTIFYADQIGTYYAKVSYNAPASLNKNGISIMAVPDEDDYKTTGKDMKLSPTYAVVDATPGFKKSATFKWTFKSPHAITNIQVYKVISQNQIGEKVYEQTRTNLNAGEEHTFTWDGTVFASQGSYAPTGRYKVKIVTADFPQWPISADVFVRNTIDTEEYDISERVTTLNQTIPSQKIRQMQTYLTDMEFYEGEITGQYNEEFLMSVIAYEAMINKWSTQVAIDVYRNHNPYLPEDGTISDRLLHFAYTDWSLGRDQFGSIYTVLYTGDGIIVALATEYVGSVAIEGIIVGVRGAKIAKEVDVIVDSVGKLSKNVIGHLTNKHNFTKYKNQIPYLLEKFPREYVEAQIAGISYFNKNWTNEMVEDAVQKAYEVALKNDVKEGSVVIEYLGEKVELAMRNGLPQTSFGSYHYTLSDFGF